MRIKKSQLVELKIFGITGGNTGTNFNFQDQPYLRGKKVMAIESFVVGDVPISPTNSTVVSAAQYLKGFLTLYCSDVDNPTSLGEWLQNIPLVVLHRVQASVVVAFVRIPYMLQGQTIIWDKSYVRLTSAFNNATDVSFLFNVYFE